MTYYAMANGYNIGVYDTWEECSKEVKGFPKAKYKKFKTKTEAEEFIENNNVQTQEPNIESKHQPTNQILYNNNPPDISYYVYTDGSCHNNGKNGSKAGIGIYFGLNDSRNVSKMIHGKQTNNTAELTAIIDTCNIIKDDLMSSKKICIVSDSVYAIRCATTYGIKNHNNNWTKNIPNKELVKKIYELYCNNTNIYFKHVKAHTNNTDIHSIGNANADLLANNAIN